MKENLQSISHALIDGIAENYTIGTPAYTISIKALAKSGQFVLEIVLYMDNTYSELIRGGKLNLKRRGIW